MANTKIKSITFFVAEDGKSVYSQQKQDLEWLWLRPQLLIAKFRLKLKKMGKTTRPYRNSLNQIPYEYVVKVMNGSRD